MSQKTTTSLSKKMLARIDRIVCEFDFDFVNRAMTQMKWRWWFAQDGANRVPTAIELKAEARRLLADVAVFEIGSRIETGGFVAWRLSEKLLLLQFVLRSEESR